MPKNNKQLENENNGLKAVVEVLQKEVKELKATAADFSLALVSDADMIAELQRRKTWPQPMEISVFSDDDLISELKKRDALPKTVASEKVEVKDDIPTDTLYHAGHYTCNVRSYNDNGKIYQFGTPLVLSKDTFLSKRPGLAYFKPGKTTKSTSLTPFGDKFNAKVPNTGSSKYLDTFKNNPSLQGQGGSIKTPPGN